MLNLLREATFDQLRDPYWVADAVCALGIERHFEDDRPNQYPAGFPVDATGHGLRIWQTPIQYAPYLVALSDLGIRSYAELGLHTGGCLITTLEYLDRFTRVERALGVDMQVQLSVRDYATHRDGLTIIEAMTHADVVEACLAAIRPDLVFVDADHSAHGCGHDYELASRYARYVALHDIVEWSCPGVAAVWDRIDAPKRAFIAQYDDNDRPLHGIGLVGPLR